MALKAFVFDLDGTLLNTIDDLTASVNFALADNGFPEHTRGEVQSYLGDGVVKLVERALPATATPQDREAVLDSFRCHYRDNCLAATKPYGGMAATVTRLHDLGYKIGVFSNKSHAETVKLTTAFFGGSVDLAQGSVSEFPRKPAADGLFSVLQRLAVAPNSAVYIGDSEVDVNTAKNANIPCIGVAWGFRGREALAAAGAAVIIDEPSELLTIAEKGLIL